MNTEASLFLLKAVFSLVSSHDPQAKVFFFPTGAKNRGTVARLLRAPGPVFVTAPFAPRPRVPRR